AGVGVGVEEEFDVVNRVDKAIQAFIRVAQEIMTRDHQLPMTVPNRTAQQTRVRILRTLEFAARPVNDQCPEQARRGNRPERLMFANGEKRLRKKIARIEQLACSQRRGANVEWEWDGHIFDVPTANAARVAQRWSAHEVLADRNQVNIRCCRQGIRVEK